MFHPPTAFFDRLASRGATGTGWGLVAVSQEGPSARVVGQASYSGLPDEDGEFAIAVAKEWRGGLGRFLLGRLAEGTAARGIPTLRANILTANRPMMTLVEGKELL